MFDWITWLFSVSDFATRDTCGVGWSSGLIAQHVISEVLTFLAYVGIPIYLFWKTRSIRSSPLLLRARPLVFFFGLFIFFCGLTHAQGALMFVWPAYRWDAILRTTTALISISTLAFLPRLVSLLRGAVGSEAETAQLHRDAKELSTKVTTHLRNVEAGIQELEGIHDQPNSDARERLERLLAEIRDDVAKGSRQRGSRDG